MINAEPAPTETGTWIHTQLPVGPPGQALRQALSTTGLVVLNASVWIAGARELFQGQICLAAGMMLVLVGLAVSGAQRWRATAHAAIALGFAGQMISVGAGVGTGWCYAGLSATAAALLAFQLRMRWPDTALSGVATSYVGLLVLAAVEQVTAGGGSFAPDVALAGWVLTAAAVTGVGATIVVVELRRGAARTARALAVVVAVGALLSTAVPARWSVLWLLGPGGLGAALGALLCWLDRRSRCGPALLLSGSALSIVVLAVDVGGTVSLCAGFGCLGVVALILAVARESPALQTAGWIAGVGQLVTLALAHPVIQGGAVSPWAPGWARWCALAGLIALELRLALRQVTLGRLADLTPRGVGAALKVTVALLLWAAASTAGGRLVRPPVLLTALWAVTAGLLLWPGRTRWHRVTGGVVGLSAAVKLFAWDWPLLDLAGRLSLLLLAGGLLLIGPLLERIPRAGDRS